MSQTGAPAVIQDTFHRKNFKTNHVLGKGGFAVVYQVTDMYSNEIFACKLTPKSKLSKKKFFEKFTSEIKIHRQLSHPYIVGVNNVFKDSINYYMLMELCDSGTLSDIVKKRQAGLTEEEVQRVAYELCMAYQYLKEHSVVHRDMKSSNVFMTSVRCQDIDPSGAKRAIACKIGDFGLSVQLEASEEKHFTLCGTPNFLPPETIVSHVFRRLKINRECDANIDGDCQELCKQLVARLTTASQGKANYEKIETGHAYPSDMWSLGCIVYQLLFQRPPFEAANIAQTYKKIVKGEYAMPKAREQLSESCINFIEQLLKVDPNDRMTVEQAMEHEWIANGKNVKLKYLPAEVMDPTFSHQWLEQNLPQFCRYRGKIAAKIQLFREGKDDTDGPMPMQIVPTVKAPVEKVEPKNNADDIETYLKKKYTHFDYQTKTIRLPDPSKFPPVQPYLNIKPENVNFDSIVKYRDTLDEADRQVVFNDYDLWCKYIKDQTPKQLNDELIHVHQHVFTLSWIDFSNRYGFAYQLSNGCVGVLFNDMSIIVLSPNLKYVDYIDLIDYRSYTRNGVQIKEGKQQDVVPEKQQFMLRMRYEHAKEFMSEKKYKLVMYFKEYLEQRSIQPLTDERKDSSDNFIAKYFDVLFMEECLVYSKSVDESTVLTAAKKRESMRIQLQKGGDIQLEQLPPCAVKMVECKIQQELVFSLVDNYVNGVHLKYGNAKSSISARMASEYLKQKMESLLLYPQVYVKRYTMYDNQGTLCILYNSKVFQVNFPDHIKVVIAHKTVTIINSKREVLIYPSTYLRTIAFEFDECRNKIAESRRLYEALKKGGRE